ncbi:MAG: 1-acyl-sn-glycerol-3-phosphate acyltransferase [Clostridia bacterium]|nr:1-acyl-sn-glycerol-3-phosphate acyltransferase [Clostridia bacterium]
MKIKTRKKSYEEVLALPVAPHQKPKRPSLLFRTLLKIVSTPDLIATRFRCERIGMEKLGKREPCLYLMNHSSFIDLKIASSILYPRPFNIVCTSDGFVGKKWLMRNLGCIPTQKFVPDLTLIRDVAHALRKLKSSVLMYPEAGYSFDGTATPLPDSLGPFLKMLNVPVVMIRTYGAFARDPLYNNLQLRRVPVRAEMEYLLSPAEIKEKTPEELNAIISEQFNFDNFRWQQENQIMIREAFRADCLNRVLYRCPHCHTEGKMVGKGVTLTCSACGKEYLLTEDGFMRATEGETEYPHIPDWYRAQREAVREEILAGTYRMDLPVDIYMLVDTKCLYRVGEGNLCHNEEGFHLTGCDGKLDYVQSPIASYTLNSDYYWYEIGDVISIGNRDALYYCFPRVEGDVVAKARLATEELYKMKKSEHRKEKHT